MSKPSQSKAKAIDLALAAAVTVFIPLVAFVLWPIISEQMTSPPQGAILVYEVDPDLPSRGAKIDMEQLVKTLDRRINSGEQKLAEVRLRDDGRIEVALLRRDDAERQYVEERLARTATLEFRILASDRRHQALIQRAMADPSAMQITDDQGKLLARWVPVKAGEVENLQAYADIVQRTRKEGQDEITEVLVPTDPYDLTGVYLRGAEAGLVSLDHRGRHKLRLTFSTAGGRLFSQLTGSHLPDKQSDLTYKLGIIINNELYSAPVIVSKIYDLAEIAGSFSKQEINDLVEMLDGGGLPAPIRLVEKKSPP